MTSETLNCVSPQVLFVQVSFIGSASLSFVKPFDAWSYRLFAAIAQHENSQLSSQITSRGFIKSCCWRWHELQYWRRPSIRKVCKKWQMVTRCSLMWIIYSCRWENWALAEGTVYSSKTFWISEILKISSLTC